MLPYTYQYHLLINRLYSFSFPCNREQYTRKIQEQENLGKNLRERQKDVREKQDTNMKQMYMWRDVERILQCKIRCADQQQGGGGGMEHQNAYNAENRLEL